MRRYFILVIVIGLVMAAGIAVAQEVADDDVIYACASEKDGDLRLVAAPEDCGKKETSVDWNQVGPEGPNGADGTDGADGADGADGTNGEVGEIAMTVAGNAWMPHAFYDSEAPISRWAASTTFLSEGAAVISLTGPAEIGGTEYRLSSFDICTILGGTGFIDSVAVQPIRSFGSDNDDEQYIEVVQPDRFVDRTETGCYTYAVDAEVGQGIGLMVTLSGEGNVDLYAVKSVWTPTAAGD